MSHALLLRLFLSPYFSISVAMHYLKTYPDSIGISHYLCWRMKSMSTEEVEFYWPQICHLLLTYPTESNALESFILSRAEESTHSAMLTFWFMQSALKDLTPTRTSRPRPFLICQRVLHRCHELIFGDVPEPSRSPYRSAPHTPSHSTSVLAAGIAGVRLGQPEDHPKLVKVNPHAAPSLVGMGVLLAGAGLPGLVEIPGQWAITQGRRPMEDEGEGRKRVEMAKGAEAPAARAVVPSSAEEKREEDSEEEELEPTRTSSLFRPSHDRRRSSGQRSVASNKPNASTAPPDTTTFPILHPAATAPSLPSNPVLSTPRLDGLTSLDTSPRQKGADPFSQMPLSPPPVPSSSRRSPSPNQKRSPHPFYSNPELNGAYSRRSVSERPPSAESLLARYSHDAQRQLLRSHYCRSEVRFLLLLEDISNRLLVIPKPARISSLRAELTSLNHNLPAEVCMPLWCSADHSHEEGGEKDSGSTLRQRPDVRRSLSGRSGAVAHSRVVRISPGDSVVLNSAERAPYLLHVEILHGDLDFDPDRRENRDLLRKIVVAEDAKRRKKEGKTVPDGSRRGSAFGSPMPDILPPVLGSAEHEGEASEEDEQDITSQRARLPTKPEEVEEMDLVEQLYGAKLSVRDQLPSLAEALPLPTAPKNKALDAAVWDRSSEASGSRRPSFAPSSMMPGGFQPGSPLSNGLMGSPANSAMDRTNGTDLQVDLLRPSTPRSPNLNPRTPSPNPSPQVNGRKLSTSSVNFGDSADPDPSQPKRYISLEDYSERMRTAAVMLAQLNASQMANTQEQQAAPGVMKWIPGTGWIMGRDPSSAGAGQHGVDHPAAPGQSQGGKLKLAAAQAAAIRERIMEEMNMLEEERVARMTERPEGVGVDGGEMRSGVEDESIVRREINKADPSAAIFKEAWAAKKSRIRASSPWGHLANWDVISVIVKTGADLRQEQLATQLIERFSRIWKEEKCDCWVRFFRILITGETSGLVETITDAVSVHSIKKSEYARRIAGGGPIGHVSLLDHFVNTYGKRDSGRFARAQRNFIKSLAGYSIVTFLLQIKDRHNGNILVDRDGHLIHIDFGFMLSNSPGGNMGFEAAPFKLPLDYVEIMGGLDSPGWQYFKKLFKEGFEAARKHSDSLITIVELMQKNSKLDCFLLFGEQTAHHLRERFALGLTTAAVDTYLDRLIVSSMGSNYTRLYDTYQYYSQGVL